MTDSVLRTAAYPSWQAWFAVIALDVQYFLLAIDMAIVTVLVRPIESALGVNDVGFATITATPAQIGMALAFYPAGMLADAMKRRDIVVAGTIVWTMATLATAFVHTPALFFGARFAAGVGSGVITPAAFSILCDALPEERRASVFGVFNAGYAIGAGLGLSACGVLVALAGHRTIAAFGFGPWQLCFVFVTVLGVAGCALALLIEEPPRRQLRGARSESARAALRTFGLYMRRHWLLWVTIFLATSALAMCRAAAANWAPAFGARHFGVADAGSIAWLGTATAFGALSGSILAGVGAQALITADLARRLPYLLACIALIACVASISLPWMPSWLWAVVAFGVIMGALQATNLLFSIVLQDGAPNQVRGQLVGLNAIITALPAIAGTTLVAFLAGHVFNGRGGLGPAMSIVCGTGGLLAAVLYICCARPFRKALA